MHKCPYIERLFCSLAMYNLNFIINIQFCLFDSFLLMSVDEGGNWRGIETKFMDVHCSSAVPTNQLVGEWPVCQLDCQHPLDFVPPRPTLLSHSTHFISFPVVNLSPATPADAIVTDIAYTNQKNRRAQDLLT